MTMSVVAINSLTDAALRSAAVEMTGAIKYSYDRAIMQHRIQRIGMDIDEGQWWIEYTEDPFAISEQRIEGEAGARVNEDGEVERPGQDDLERELGFDRDTDPEVRRALEGGRAASFIKEDGETSRELPRGVKFSRVWTGHQEEPFNKGIAYLHFFTSGWTEPAYIELMDADEDVVVLEVQPLTGRVRTSHDPFEAPDVEDYDGYKEGDE